jgi:hypothetical protein
MAFVVIKTLECEQKQGYSEFSMMSKLAIVHKPIPKETGAWFCNNII